MIRFEDIKNNPEIRVYIKKADESLKALGFTEHSFAHVGLVAERCRYILETLGASKKDVELAQIAAFMHDIGNLVNRSDHSQSGALMAFRILGELGMDAEDICDIVAAIGTHDEGTGVPVSRMAAALIIADKSDVRKTRVRDMVNCADDIHGRVNHSVNNTELFISEDNKDITLKLDIDTNISSVMEYFEIFLTRMKLCKTAAETLGMDFKLFINEQQLL